MKNNFDKIKNLMHNDSLAKSINEVIDLTYVVKNDREDHDQNDEEEEIIYKVENSKDSKNSRERIQDIKGHFKKENQQRYRENQENLSYIDRSSNFYEVYKVPQIDQKISEDNEKIPQDNQKIPQNNQRNTQTDQKIAQPNQEFINKIVEIVIADVYSNLQDWIESDLRTFIENTIEKKIGSLLSKEEK